MRVDREPELSYGPSSEVGEEPFRNLDVGIALPTNQVAVRCARKMIGRRPVPEMGVRDHTEALELLQVPVHGRDGDVGCASLNLRRELLSCSMPCSLEQGTDEKASRCGHAVPS